MAAGLHSLHDQPIRPGAHGTAGVGERCDLDKHVCTGVSSHRNQLGVDAPGERHDGRALVQDSLQSLALLEREHQIHTERRPADRS